ncbi:MAG: murein DD-endopeptidase MepM/ murein hydrolase activator NlpD, partial [Alteromonadaceae bacterium]
MNLKTWITCLLSTLLYPSVGMAKNKLSQVYWEESDNGSVTFFADNKDVIPHWVNVQLSKMKNFKPSQAAPFTFTLEPNSKKAYLFKLKPEQRNNGYHFEVITLIIPGKEPQNTRHDDQYIYQFPFEHGTKHKLGQGYFGSATHKKPNPYALDFNMDEGTPVHAARGGIVSEVKQDSNIGGPSSKYAKHGNHIVIYQPDGTFANYVHLKKNGALVNPGDKVIAGQAIGLSGNTGQSSGPHLHFEVSRYAGNGSSNNLPVRFLNHDQQKLSNLKEGQFYYATDPNKANYTVSLGANLKHQDFDGTITSQLYTDKLVIVPKQVDDTVALYAQNGKESAMAIELSLKLKNFKASKKGPIIDLIPPLSEKFLVFLQPINSDKVGQYSLSLKNRAIGKSINDADYKNYAKLAKRTDTIKINQKEHDDKLLLFVANGYNQSKEVTVELTLLNMKASKSSTLTVSVPPLTEIYLQHDRPIAVMKATR